MNHSTYHKALTIAGSDSGGGAGIQADLKTFSALGCYGMSVITALTAQNTTSVNGILKADAEFVANQLTTVLDDIDTDAIKIGMLFSSDIIKTVAIILRERNSKNVVLDPVMISKSGANLLQEEASETLFEELLPLADIVTPNLDEAEKLTGIKVETEEDMIRIGKNLMQIGCKAVLVKGGHLEGDSASDFLIYADGGNISHRWYKEKRITTKNTHGTGCTYSSAIAAYLARGLPLQDAVTFSKKYITEAITSGAEYKLGAGHGPVHHFHQIWNH